MHIPFLKRAAKSFNAARLVQALVGQAALLILAACSTVSTPRVQPPSSLPAAKSPSRSVPNTGLGKTFQITIRDDNFQPAELSVPVGTTVVWTTVGQDQHTVTADDKSFISGTLNAGDVFKYTFTKSGTFLYHCEFHGFNGGMGMSGAVTVVSAGSSLTDPNSVYGLRMNAPGLAPLSIPGGLRPGR